MLYFVNKSSIPLQVHLAKLQERDTLMRRIFLFAIVAILTTTLSSCRLFGTPTPNPVNPVAGDLPALSLTVQAQAGTYNAVGQTIPYTYVVTNIGTAPLTGPLTIVDDKVGVICPDIITVGNKDNNLDSQESLTCASSYAIIQADLNAGAVTSNATAKAGSIQSNTVNTVVQMTLSRVLALTITADATTYNQAGKIITFTYSVKNTGTATLGPAQFVVSVDRLGSINCLDATTILATNESVTCNSTYEISQNDMVVNALTFNGVATGAGAGVIQPVSLTLTNTTVASNPTTSPPSNLTRGSTIQHKVVAGEWMLQIARCYGADFYAVRNANPQVVDPHWILPDTILSVPNIGSNGNIYGPPCIEYYTAQPGDTWNSIAQKYNADLAVLLEANQGVTLASGVKVRVPKNSANGTPVPVPTGPIRINFPAGSTTATVSGSVSQQNKVRYVVNAAQGQTMTVKLTAPVNEVELVVSASANAASLKALDAAQTWTGTIPATGDYYIDVISVQTTTTKNYTLEVDLVTPTPAAFVRVADINTGAGDSNPSYLSVFNNTLYFQATGADNTGAELWKFDSAQQAASRVVDINPGTAGSAPAFLTSYNGALYFSANGNDGAGIELWRFNGSAAGRVGDINPGAGDGNPSYMAVFNNLLYFGANGNDGAGNELWQTDGTAITRTADIHPGTGDSNPAYLTVFNNALYFSATSNDGAGTELWKFDGTTATRVADINNGIGNSNPSFLTVFNNALYFSANGNDGTGTELWKFDGTTASRVADINPGAGDSGPTFLTVFNNVLYFSANGNDGHGIQLWKYDGTNATRVSDINSTGNFNPQYLAVFDNSLFFQANGGDGAGVELWKFMGP
jgi:ELWxxDGT repeat protein